MARKVFLSVLGSTNYSECIYVKKEEYFKSRPVRFIQEAMFDYLNAKNWSSDSVGYIFVTKEDAGSEKKNWFDNGHTDNQNHETIICEGLKTRISGLKLPFDVKPVPIPDGNTEDEIWEIFETIFDQIRENDEIYFDITHGFRFLPMLALVLLNYAKFLRNINVRHISYGNFDGRNKDTNEAPIINLLSLSSLQDWTNATNQFVINGSVKNLKQLIGIGSITNALEKFSDSFSGSRGVDIWQGASALELSEELSNIELEHYPAPFKPILDQVKQKVRPFERGNLIERGIEAVKYCKEHNLIQQGITLLAELIVTYTLLHINHDWQDNFARVIASSCLNINNKEKYDADRVKSDIEQKFDDERISLEEMESSILKHDIIVDKIFSLKIKETLGKKIYSKLSQGTRNDINHAGVRQNPKTTGELQGSFEKYLNKFIEFYNQNPCS